MLCWGRTRVRNDSHKSSLNWGRFAYKTSGEKDSTLVGVSDYQEVAVGAPFQRLHTQSDIVRILAA